LVQQVAECDDREHAAQRDRRLAHPPADEDQRAADELDERDHRADRPQRPHRQERVAVRQEPLARVLEWSLIEHLVDAGHGEDQPEHHPGKHQGPRTTRTIRLAGRYHAAMVRAGGVPVSAAPRSLSTVVGVLVAVAIALAIMWGWLFTWPGRVAIFRATGGLV